MAGYHRALRIVVNGLALLSLMLNGLPVLQVVAAPPPESGAIANDNLSLRDWRSAYSSLRPSSTGSRPSSASGIESDLPTWQVTATSTPTPTTSVQPPFSWGKINLEWEVKPLDTSSLVWVDAGNDFNPGEELVVNLSPDIQAMDGAPLPPYEWRIQAAAVSEDAVFSDSGQLQGPSTSHTVILGDLNHDGDLDVFVAKNGLQTSEVWRNVEMGTDVFTLSLETGGEDVMSGDLNGDCHMDALLRTSTTSDTWLNVGTGTLTRSFAANCADMAPGDLDGYGDLDAVASDIGANSRVWLNDGSGVFTLTQSLTGTDTLSWSLDGSDDVWTFSYSEVWLNDGSEVFNLAQSEANAQGTTVDLRNVDKDNDLDAFLGTNFGGKLIWENLGRLLWAAIHAEPRTALVEQQTVQLTIWVTNISGVTVDDVQPWLKADDTHLVSGPQPVSGTLEAAESITFTLTYTVSEPGTIIWQGGATGVDTTSGIIAMSPSTVSNAVSVVEADQAWIQRQPVTSSFAQDDVALVYYDSARGVIFLFDGWGESERPSDTREYRSTEGWMTAQTEHASTARWQHATAYDSGWEVTALGGGSGTGGALSDIWEYDGSNWH